MGCIGLKIVDAHETVLDKSRSADRHIVPYNNASHLLCIHLLFCCTDVVYSV